MNSSISEKMARFKKVTSIKGWLAVMLGVFSLLAVVSVSLTFWQLDTQKHNAEAINLAGRQRMLIQQMVSLSLEVQQGSQPRKNLLGVADTFEQSLLVLQNGGEITDFTNRTMVIDRPGNASIRNGLAVLKTEWLDFRKIIDQLAAMDQGDVSPVVLQIKQLAPQLLHQIERVVLEYENASTEKIQRLRWIQIGFILSGLLCLGLIGWLFRGSVIQPLSRLDAYARRIGEGNLDAQVTVYAPVEIQILAKTMENMRVQLLDSRKQAQQFIATLESRVQQRTQALEALAGVNQEISSHLSIHDVFRSVTEKAQQLLGSEVALLCLLDAEGANLKVHAASGPDNAILAPASSVDLLTSGQVLQGKKAIPCGSLSCSKFCKILSPQYQTSHLAAPLRIGEQVIGAMCVGSEREDIFPQESTQILSQLAGITAVALENSRLYRQAEQIAALQERQHIASDMHDGLLQTLSFLRWMARLSEEQLAQNDVQKARATFHQIERAVEQAENEIRQAIASMQEAGPGKYTLQEQLAEMVQERRGYLPAVKLESNVNIPVVLSRVDSEQIIRVAREALLNAQNHSQAEHVVVRLERCDGMLILSIIDDGKGFSVEKVLDGEIPGDERAHFGVKIMHARAARINGRIDIQSGMGSGTRVTLSWPWQN